MGTRDNRLPHSRSWDVSEPLGKAILIALQLISPASQLGDFGMFVKDVAPCHLSELVNACAGIGAGYHLSRSA